MGAHVPPLQKHTHTHPHESPPTNRDCVDKGKGKGKVKLRSGKKNDVIWVLHYSNWLLIVITFLCNLTSLFWGNNTFPTLKAFIGLTE